LPLGPIPPSSPQKKNKVHLGVETPTLSISAPKVGLVSFRAAGSLGSRPQHLPTGPYLETRREKEASRSPRIPSSDRRHCPRSCPGTRTLCLEPPSAETLETNGPGVLPSGRLHSKCCLHTEVRTEVRPSPVEPEGSEVRPPPPIVAPRRQGQEEQGP
jgi:hypothetical protein